MDLNRSKTNSVHEGKDRVLTIVIPTFNGEATIKRALSSAISEIESNSLESVVEVLIADNCSTDSTSEIVERVAVEKDFIQICKTKINISLYDNLQTAFSIITTPYVKILCDDDFLLPGYLQHLLSIIEENPQVDLILSTMEAIGKTKGESSSLKPSRVSKFNNNADFIRATGGAYGQVSTLCFRTSSWHEGKKSPLFKGHSNLGMEWIAHFYHLAMYGQCLLDDSLLMENDQGPKRWNKSYLDVFKVNCAHMSFILRMDSLGEQEFPNRLSWQEWIFYSKKSMIRQFVLDVISLRRNKVSVRDQMTLECIPNILRTNRYFFLTKIVDFIPKFMCTFIIRLVFVLEKTKTKYKNLKGLLPRKQLPKALNRRS